MKQNSDNENPSSRKRRAVLRTRSVSGTLRQRESIVPPKYTSDNENPSYRPSTPQTTRIHRTAILVLLVAPGAISRTTQERRTHRQQKPESSLPPRKFKTVLSTTSPFPCVGTETHNHPTHPLPYQPRHRSQWKCTPVDLVESVIFLSSLLFNTGSFSERGTGDDLSQRRRNPCIKHLKIRKRLSTN